MSNMRLSRVVNGVKSTRKRCRLLVEKKEKEKLNQSKNFNQLGRGNLVINQKQNLYLTKNYIRRSQIIIIFASTEQADNHFRLIREKLSTAKMCV